jgi:competence protein ComEC
MDGGERLAVPELRRLGVKEIDLVILTHPDADHIGGLAAISRKFPIRRVAFAEHFRSHPALVEVLSSLPSSTEKWALVRDEVLRWPGGEILIDFVPPSSRNDDNDGSVAGIVRVGPGSLVFTGDASAKIESTLAERGDWSAQILKLGHHGSDDATSSPWIEEVQPLYAVASSGRTNSYGHPGPKVQERLESAGIPLYRTDEEGTVIFELGPKGFYRPSR